MISKANTGYCHAEDLQAQVQVVHFHYYFTSVIAIADCDDHWSFSLPEMAILSEI